MFDLTEWAPEAALKRGFLLVVIDIFFSAICLCFIDFSVRLTGSPISNAGQVEVFYAGVWGTIDSYQWNIRNAHVVCRQLGYPGALSSGASSQFGVGEQRVWFSKVRCLGNESSIQDCPEPPKILFGRRRASTALCKLPYQPGNYDYICLELSKRLSNIFI